MRDPGDSIKASVRVGLLIAAIQLAALTGGVLAPDQTRGETAKEGPARAVVLAPTVRLPVISASGLRFRHLSTSNGLSQTRVSEIVQDDKGFMWFATQYGLNRFDGYAFKLYVHDPRSTDSLSGTYSYALFKDRSGMIWVGCNQRLDRFDPRSEHFTHFRIVEPALPTIAGTVVHISQDRAGNLWLATGSGLHRLDPSTGLMRHFHHDPQRASSLSTDDIKWSGEDREGRFWVGTADGLDEFDREAGAVRRHIPLPDPVQISLFEDRAGTFWIVHASGTGLAVFDATSNTVTPYSFYDEDPPADALTGVMGVVEDRAGHLWFGSPGLGLLQYDRTGRRVIWYRNHPRDPHSIGEDKVIALFLDRDGDVWTGLHSAGVAYFSDEALPFERFEHDPDDPNSLSLNFVNTIFESRDRTLWIGNDDGINRIERASGKRSLLDVGFPRNPMVISIMEDREGWMWFGTFADGLRRWDPKSGHYRVYRHDAANPLSLSNNEVHRIFVDHKGAVWIATDDGLDRFDPTSETFQTFKPDPTSRLSQRYVRIAEDSKGILWLGTGQSGLHRFAPTTGEFTLYRASPGDPEALRDDTVPAVYVDQSDIVWAGTQNGLSRLDPKTGRFRSYDTRDGLPANTISCIRADSHGRLWMSTNHGISRFDPAVGTFANYAESDGFPGDDFTGWSTCAAATDGELFFGGFSGAVGFYPDELVESDARPPVVLTELEIAGRPEPVTADGGLRQSISYSSAITLTHQQNEFSISFAGLRYRSPSSNRYRYRLLGLDREWREVDSANRRATYTTLPAGPYEFQVQAATGHGPWNEPGTSLRIQILPPWWATWWFR
ncbi:MAG TPA: two-component regulator propeller domain-containing protein, partial [Chloroflexota bacterium]|nr:two-component regulator propeller domain-containing protein [Chloroflexota bacterium]